MQGVAVQQAGRINKSGEIDGLAIFKHQVTGNHAQNGSKVIQKQVALFANGVGRIGHKIAVVEPVADSVQLTSHIALGCALGIDEKTPGNRLQAGFFSQGIVKPIGMNDDSITLCLRHDGGCQGQGTVNIQPNCISGHTANKAIAVRRPVVDDNILIVVELNTTATLVTAK